MRIKLDENLPRSLCKAFSEAGHACDTVADEGLNGSGDPEVLAPPTRMTES